MRYTIYLKDDTYSTFCREILFRYLLDRMTKKELTMLGFSLEYQSVKNKTYNPDVVVHNINQVLGIEILSFLRDGDYIRFNTKETVIKSAIVPTLALTIAGGFWKKVIAKPEDVVIYPLTNAQFCNNLETRFFLFAIMKGLDFDVINRITRMATQINGHRSLISTLVRFNALDAQLVDDFKSIYLGLSQTKRYTIQRSSYRETIGGLK